MRMGSRHGEDGKGQHDSPVERKCEQLQTLRGHNYTTGAETATIY